MAYKLLFNLFLSISLILFHTKSLPIEITLLSLDWNNDEKKITILEDPISLYDEEQSKKDVQQIEELEEDTKTKKLCIIPAFNSLIEQGKQKENNIDATTTKTNKNINVKKAQLYKMSLELNKMILERRESK